MTTQHTSKAMIIDGIASAECPDSSFEILRLKGADISTLEGGKAPLSWEHKSVEKDAPNHTPLDVVGVITKAKKIFSEKDCENEREKKYWNSVKVPFLYIIGRLYDAAGHPAAIALAAIIRDHVQNGEPPMVEFSVEGSTLSREGHELTETVLRLVTMTVKPCHKLATSGLLSDPGAPEGFDKSPAKEGSVKDILAELAATYKSADGISHKVSSYSIQVDPEVPSELAKTITAGGMGGAPGSLTGGAALQREEIGFRKRKLSAIAKAIARDYRKEHGDLREVVKAILDKAQMPDVSDEFLNHYTGLIDDIRLSLKKSEPLDKMALLHNDPANPLTVYRVQNEHGDGPYGNMGALDNSHDNPSAQPDPDEDFSLQDNYAAGIQKSKPLYAFKKPEDAEAWFGRPALDRMKKKGFELKPVLASRAWISDSGKQVVFHPSLKKSEGDDEGPPTAKGPLTIRGKAVQPNTGMKTGKIDFDEQNGILHTDRGSFPLYNPDKDTEVPESGEKFKAVWHSPEVRKQHDYATRNWLRVHQALKAGKLPSAVLASAVAFSHLSRNTGVPTHELMYGHLLDTMKEKGMDPRHPDFGSDDTYQNWINRDRPNSTPKSSTDYYLFDIDPAISLKADAPANKEEAKRLKDPEYRERQSALRVAGLPNEIEGRLEGERPNFQIAANKFADIATYHQAHDAFSRIVQQHGTDTRGAVRALMEAKVSRLAHKARQRQQEAKGKEIPDWQGEQIVPGLAQKTGRFAYSMLGGGNSIVPDTHMVRHLFGLDKDLDSATNEYLKQRVLWQPKNTDLLESVDRWYFKNHPAVKYMLEHPEFKNAFRADPEQAVFPAFWSHWLSISPHEASIGRGSALQASNTQASHRPYFDEFDRLMEHPQESKDVIPGKNVFARTIPRGIKKAESIPGGPLIDPADAAQLVHDWTKQVGHAGALFRYYAHLVPLLYPEEHIHPGVSFHESPFSKSLALEAAVIDLRKSLIDLESLSKDEEGTQPGIPKAKAAAPKSKMPPGVIDAKIHGLGSLNISPEQLKLIHGLDLSKKLDESEIPVHTADGVTEPQWKRHPSGKLVLVKGEMPDGSDAHIEGIARREAAYHNLAKHFFGLGDFVPTTAAVRHPLTNETHSVQEEVPDASHVDVKKFSENGYGYMPEDKRQESWIRKHQVNGDLDKIHVMNMVLGNNDRHTGNLLVTPHEPHVRLIDHSHCFDYHGDHSEIKTPAYFRLQQGMRYKEEARRNPEADQHGQIPDHFGNEPIHPDAAKWLQSLDHEKLADLVRAFGVGEKAAKRASGSLQIIKSRLARNPKIARSDLLTDTAPYESRK